MSTIQTIFIYLIIALIVLSEIYIKHHTKKNKAEHSADDGTRYVIIASVVLSLLSVNLDNLAVFRVELPSIFLFLGFALAIFTIALRLYAVNYLGKAFTLAVQTTDQQKLVDSGPYAIVRNPAYTGSILSLLGLSLITLNLYSFLLSLLVLVVGYAIRLRVEEKVLGEHFGQDYQDYCSKVKYRIFPFIW